MTWEKRKQSIHDAVERILKIGEEKGTEDISFSFRMHLDSVDEFEYTIGGVVIQNMEVQNELFEALPFLRRTSNNRF